MVVILTKRLLRCYNVVFVSAKDDTMCCDETKVQVFANGTCLWYREFRLSVSQCDIDITWFPFDIQVCQLIYESKNFASSELNITGMSPLVELTSYTSSGEYDLLGKTSTSRPLHANQVLHQAARTV